MRPCTVCAAGNVGGIDEAQPIERRGGAARVARGTRLYVAFEFRPGREAVFASHARLRIVKSQAKIGNAQVVLAGRNRQGVADAGYRGGITALIEGKEVLCLLL